MTYTEILERVDFLEKTNNKYAETIQSQKLTIKELRVQLRKAHKNVQQTNPGNARSKRTPDSGGLAP